MFNLLNNIPIYIERVHLDPYIFANVIAYSEYDIIFNNKYINAAAILNVTLFVC